jgi:hypothetical protein
MGERFQEPDKANPKGYYEAIGLKAIVLAKGLQHTAAVAALQKWARKRAKAGSLIGAKHYYLCKMVPEMFKAWPGMKAVAINRPIADVVQSQRKAGFRNWLSEEQLAQRSQSFVTERDKGLKFFAIPTLTIAFADLIAHPEAEIERIIEFLGIRPTNEQIGAALASIQPDLRHFRSETAQ